MDEPDTDPAVLWTRQMALRAIMDGRGAEVAVLRAPAKGTRAGSLVVNPGGPGGSGWCFSTITSLKT